MTIKELEERSGLARANIRYYENEGLIHPARKENGYRDYSQEDLAELEKIKLLRALGLSLEDIRLAQGGEKLEGLLAEHLPKLRDSARQTQGAIRVCEQLQEEKAEYARLDAERYLSALEDPAAPESDALPKVREPWRRFWARWLDLSIYSAIWWFILARTPVILLDDSYQVVMTLFHIMAMTVLLLLLEPACLHFFGTTPGKRIMGLWVTDQDGGRLSYRAALERTANALVYGWACWIPVLDLVYLWKNYGRCEQGEELFWEKDSLLVQKSRKNRQYGVCLALIALLTVFAVDQAVTQYLPRNIGEMTVAEFAENFNRAAHYQNYMGSVRLDEEGKWIDWEGTVVEIPIFGETDSLGEDDPVYEYTVEEGQLVKIRIPASRTGENMPVQEYDYHYTLPATAFVRAQRGVHSLRDGSKVLFEQLRDHPWENWELEVNGVRVTNEFTCTGYQENCPPELIGLFPREGERQHYERVFTMELIR